MSVLSAIFTLLFVMDPLGNIPLFITVLKNVPPERRRKIVVRELFIALGILIFFLFFGKLILDLMSIDQISLSVAGGIVLFLIALQMIFPSKHNTFADSPAGEPFIVPLAIPLVVGPSVMSMVLIMVSQSDKGSIHWLGIIGAAWLLNSVVLLLAFPISRILGERGMIAMERLMGMLLTTISIQMLLSGIGKLLKAN